MSGAAGDEPGRCATCGDVAERGRVVALDGTEARVELASGECITVAVDLVHGVGVGQTLLVHGGVAIGRVAIGTIREEPS